MRKLSLLLSCFIWASHTAAQSPVSAIPDSLKEGANAVYQIDKLTYRILSPGHALEKKHIVVTILNAQGKRQAVHGEWYDKLSSIKLFSVRIYDLHGKLVRTMKNNEIEDVSASGSSLFQDDRLKVVDAAQPTYPYTVEFESEVEYNYLFHIPSWSVLDDQKISVMRSEFTIEFPPTLAPKYKVLNAPDRVIKHQITPNLSSYSWTFNNIKAITLEDNGPTIRELYPVILAGPSQFEFSNYTGTMESWESFGRWIQKLNAGRDQLPEETKTKILSLVKNCKTDEEKVRLLYNYLQEKTRYVSIQLGIGGYQPFQAAQVDQTSYGDCKALSNYMVSLLRVAGIDANYVLIRAGRDESDIISEFPSSQFNHAIVAVPNKGDTIWLECTSQTNPFGYMGRFTGDRHAVLINNNGGHVVKTITYPTENNVQSRRAEVDLLALGDATAKVKTMYTGLQYENSNLHFALTSPYTEQKEWVNKTTEIPNFEVTKFKLFGTNERLPKAYVELDLSLKRLASVSGKRLFLSPNLMNRMNYVPKQLERRKTDIVEDFGYVDYDTINIKIPEGLYPEFAPAPIKIKSRFGEYDAGFSIKEGMVTYTRRMQIEKGRFPKESYQEFLEFYKNVSKADNLKLVFLSKT